MLQDHPALNNADAAFGLWNDHTTWGPGSLETILESAATDIAPGTATITHSDGSQSSACWEVPGCDALEATGHGWVFVDHALAVLP